MMRKKSQRQNQARREYTDLGSDSGEREMRMLPTMPEPWHWR